ncbi:hypothetical protein SDC9_167791 [bioreactor metagenome]|uniref:Uncharacterized protein n=1 Tax=bioreactor metagenome TaxID=1076179 RepID=A0A645G390_9ZZZZ
MAEVAVQPVVGVLPHGAGVEHHHVRVGARRGGHVPRLVEQSGDPLGIAHVHLAAVRPHLVRTRQGSPVDGGRQGGGRRQGGGGLVHGGPTLQERLLPHPYGGATGDTTSTRPAGAEHRRHRHGRAFGAASCDGPGTIDDADPRNPCPIDPTGPIVRS